MKRITALAIICATFLLPAWSVMPRKRDGYIVLRSECGAQVVANANANIFSTEHEAVQDAIDTITVCKLISVWAFRLNSSGEADYEVLFSHDNHDFQGRQVDL